MLNLNSYTSKIDEGKRDFFYFRSYDGAAWYTGFLGTNCLVSFLDVHDNMPIKGNVPRNFCYVFPSIFLPITLLKSLFKGKGI